MYNLYKHSENVYAITVSWSVHGIEVVFLLYSVAKDIFVRCYNYSNELRPKNNLNEQVNN